MILLTLQSNSITDGAAAASQYVPQMAPANRCRLKDAMVLCTLTLKLLQGIQTAVKGIFEIFRNKLNKMQSLKKLTLFYILIFTSAFSALCVIH